jgi:phosphopantetheine adenylyltransferase
MSKSVVLTFGRFNPPTNGHEKLVDKVKRVAGGSEHRIYTSLSNDAKKNPLPYVKKIKYLRKGFKDTNIIEDPTIVTVFHALKKLSNDGYTDVILVVGSDRVKEFDRGIRRYINHKDKKLAYYFDNFKVVSAGQRDPDSDSVSGMSASKMRGFVAGNDLDSFLEGVPSKMSRSDGIRMFNDLKRHMSINEDIEFDFEENPEEIYEISLKGRRNIARASKRSAKKRSRSRARKKKFIKGADGIKKMAQKEARNKIRKRIIKDRDWSSLSLGERERVEKELSKKRKVIAKIMTRILPRIRKKEMARIKALRGANESHIYKEEHGAGEEGTSKLLKKYKKDTPNE